MKFKIEFNNGSVRLGQIDGLGYDTTKNEISIISGMNEIVLKPNKNLMTDWCKLTIFDGSYKYNFTRNLGGLYIPNLSSTKFEQIPYQQMATNLESNTGNKFSEIDTLYWTIESIYFH